MGRRGIRRHRFVRAGKRRDVFVRRLWDGAVQQVTDLPGQEWAPAWSPVPGRLAFWATSGPEPRGLFLVTRDAKGSWSEPELLFARKMDTYDWLPDGEGFACLLDESIVVLSIDSRDVRVVYEPAAPDDPPVISTQLFPSSIDT